MTVWQVVLDWLLSQILLLLYLHYYNSNPRASAQNTVDAFNHPPDEGHGETSHTLQYNPRDHDKHPVAGVAIIAIIIVYLLVLGPSLALLSPPVPDAGYYIILQIWSWATIAIALVLAIAYYVPQIVHTYRLKRTGSLSLISLTIQVPTYFLMALSMGLQYGSVYETFFENYFRVYSVWCNHLISGLAESGLLGLCAYLAYKKSRRNEEIKRQVEEAERHGSAADEHTPLLIDGLGKGDTAD
ncbi:hypothetical protein PRK78_006165 [Emydomyces testavorans]|uniref:Uncharacterized protein n=1 Tax=Emydomyces testavorans TaxID=2070801 RepID=A0AAF0DLH5_9EURO|nr:hypothetical protein PRK78_006165 [Emydomyces testavorans]